MPARRFAPATRLPCPPPQRGACSPRSSSSTTCCSHRRRRWTSRRWSSTPRCIPSARPGT